MAPVGHGTTAPPAAVASPPVRTSHGRVPAGNQAVGAGGGSPRGLTRFTHTSKGHRSDLVGPRRKSQYISKKSLHSEIKRTNSPKKRVKKLLYLEAKKHVLLNDSLIKEENETEIKFRAESQIECDVSERREDADKEAFRGTLIAVIENQTGGKSTRRAAASRSQRQRSRANARRTRTEKRGRRQSASVFTKTEPVRGTGRLAFREQTAQTSVGQGKSRRMGKDNGAKTADAE